MTHDTKKCPNNIRIARTMSGLSQKEVAISLKVSPPTISDWENCNKYPSIPNLIALSELFCVSSDFLIGCTNDFESSHFSRFLTPYLLEKLRNQRNETISQVSDATGIPVEIYQSYEQSTNASPSYNELLNLSKHFCISVKELLGERFYCTDAEDNILTSDFSTSPSEQHIIELRRRLKPEAQERLFQNIMDLLGNPDNLASSDSRSLPTSADAAG